MNCNKIQDLLDDHVDGLLPAPEAEAVREHLDRCVDCREDALATRAATQSLTRWGDVEPPPACFESILARIENLPPEARQRPAPQRLIPLPRLDEMQTARVRRFATSGLAAAAAVLAALVIARSDPRTTRREKPWTDLPIVPAGNRARPAVETGALFPGFEIDDGLFRYDATPGKADRAPRPRFEVPEEVLSQPR